MVDLIIFPSSYFDEKKVDEDLETEYEAVKETGLFQIVIFGYEKWFNKDKLVLTLFPEKMQKAVYRGWMMKPEKYEMFYELLKNSNIELVTTPAEYTRMHIFPNIYSHFGTDTAKMITYPLHEKIDVDILKREFSRFMVKDFVKSVKGTEFPRFFDQDITQEDFDNWMEVFYKYRGNLLTGGICVKEFLNLKYYGEKTNEYRVFYINHKIATVSKNSAQPSYAAEIPMELIEKYNNIDSIYYTVDFAEIEDGTWRIIEAGDGSVSGLSEFQSAEQYFRTLYYCFL